MRSQDASNAADVGAHTVLSIDNRTQIDSITNDTIIHVTCQSPVTQLYMSPANHQWHNYTCHLPITNDTIIHVTCQSSVTQLYMSPANHQWHNSTCHLPITSDTIIYVTCQSPVTQLYMSPANHQWHNYTCHLPITSDTIIHVTCQSPVTQLYTTSRVPVEGKSSVCQICMKYRIFLIIIIISLGQILSYITNTSCTYARMNGRTHTREHTHPHTHHRRSGYRYPMGIWHPTVTARSAGDNGWSLAIEINTGTGGPVSLRFWVFFAYKKF